MIDFLEEFPDIIPSDLVPFYSLCPELEPISFAEQAPQTQTKQEDKCDFDLNDFLVTSLRKKDKSKGHGKHKNIIRSSIVNKWIEDLEMEASQQANTLVYYQNFVFKKLEDTLSLKQEICQKKKDRMVTKGVYDDKIRRINATLWLVAKLYKKFPTLKENRSEIILKEIEDTNLKKPPVVKTKRKLILTNFEKTQRSESEHELESKNVIVPPLTMDLRTKRLA
ncbi:MAG: hypothetical protein JSR17_10470 [Proteobacteria bacterium]|nr:hypothetical protein [Pseudomonadota bacterium]